MRARIFLGCVPSTLIRTGDAQIATSCPRWPFIVASCLILTSPSWGETPRCEPVKKFQGLRQRSLTTGKP